MQHAGAHFYDEPGWEANLAALQGSYRLDILRAGLLLVERTAARGDHARARELAAGVAAALDTELRELPGEMRWYLVDLRPSGARGIQRQGFHSLDELLVKLGSLVAFKAWILRQGRPGPAGKPG